MKKSNVIVLALLALVSAFLLWLWYFLGFNRVDDPLDLVLSIVWWVVIAAAVLVIMRLEKTRRRRVRTVYVGDSAAFNSERGIVPLDPALPVADSVAAVLGKLEYDFGCEDFPAPEDLEVRYLIRTDEFEPADRADSQPAGQAAGASAGQAASASAAAGQPAGAGAPAGQPVGASPVAAAWPTSGRPAKWTGEVQVVGLSWTRTFDTPEELARIIAAIPKAA